MIIRLILSAFAISLGLFTTLSCTPSGTSPVVYREFCEVLKEYEAAYEVNEVAAQNTFNGTHVKVSGSLASLEDNYGYPMAILVNFGCQSNIYALTELECRWNQSYVSEVLTLRKGQTINIKGVFLGGKGHGGVYYPYGFDEAQLDSSIKQK